MLFERSDIDRGVGATNGDSGEMTLQQILTSIRDFGFYTESEWQAYVSHFDGIEDIPYHPGRQPSEWDEDLLKRILRHHRAPIAPVGEFLPKLVSARDLARIRTNTDMTLGIVSGAFDLLHLGHARNLAFAAGHVTSQPGGKLCAITIEDEQITKTKGSNRPVLNICERISMLSALRCVDFVLKLDTPNCLSALRLLRPHYFYKAQADLARPIVRAEVALTTKLGGESLIFPSSGGRRISTTLLLCWIEDHRRYFNTRNQMEVQQWEREKHQGKKTGNRARTGGCRPD